jgi:hypothetical protein
MRTGAARGRGEADRRVRRDLQLERINRHAFY